MEEWRDVPGYKGLYQVSNLGKVKSFKFNREILLSPRFDRSYYNVTLYRDSKPKQFKIHRLVAEAFIENPLRLPYINHKDENKLNNEVHNLEWCTQKYNVNYGRAQKKRVYSQSKPVVCIETGIKYQTAVEAGKRIGINYKHICDCCKGRRKTTGNYHWKYAEQGGDYHLFV